MIRIGVIGVGYWGPNLIRNLYKVEECSPVAVADVDPQRLAVMGRLYPGLRTVAQAEEVLHAPDVDAVVIATPISTHFALAREALRSGKHVLVEKPMTATDAIYTPIAADPVLSRIRQRSPCMISDGDNTNRNGMT